MITEAPICRAALTEATRFWPKRSTASDGILPSAAHTLANPTSDHELGNAFDLTHDPGAGADCNVLSEWLKASGDIRVKYIIWNRRIWNPSVSPAWRVYEPKLGKFYNPHTKHMHVSINSAYRSATARPWWQIRVEQQSNLPQGEQVMPEAIAYSPIKFFVPTVTGKGYWIVTEDGGIYAFGDAGYFGRVVVKEKPE